MLYIIYIGLYLIFIIQININLVLFIIFFLGTLSSLDDFYLLGTGFFVTQTTNNVFNTSLFSLVTPKALFAWQRVRAAHALACTGKQWAQIFSKHNSGETDIHNAKVHHYMQIQWFVLAVLWYCLSSQPVKSTEFSRIRCSIKGIIHAEWKFCRHLHAFLLLNTKISLGMFQLLLWLKPHPLMLQLSLHTICTQYHLK